ESFTGPRCERCAADLYGPNCSVYCTANGTCSGQGVCRESDGGCECELGWGGRWCNVSNTSATVAAPSGCLSARDCNATAGRALCVNGSCVCKESFTGPRCERCAADLYGPNCSVYCTANGTCSGQGVCRESDGGCECELGWGGRWCNVSNTSATVAAPSGCLSARDCNATAGRALCVNGSCVCKESFTGPRCERCAADLYGPNCSVYCTANGTCSGQGVCRESDGGCECELGWGGRWCNVSNTSATVAAPSGCLSARDCNATAGRALCVNGSCVCKESFTGPRCERCAADLYGPNCSVYCTANGTCSGQGVCRESDGGCECELGWGGRWCNVSNTSATVAAPSGCLSARDCNATAGRALCVNGSCVCKESFTGPRCERCAADLYGPNCSVYCTANGTCSRQGVCRESDGGCECELGWGGRWCNASNASSLTGCFSLSKCSSVSGYAFFTWLWFGAFGRLLTMFCVF
ncbi:hypothetical protein GUITHDRAFT_109523, partial [Guillardia theta CCMP2712]